MTIGSPSRAKSRGPRSERVSSIDLPSGVRSVEADTLDDTRHLAFGYKIPRRDVTSVPFGKLDPGSASVDTGSFQWVSTRTKYWLVALMQPSRASPRRGVLRRRPASSGTSCFAARRAHRRLPMQRTPEPRVAMVVLLITFGSIVAAGLPMLTALIGVGTGMAAILWASSVIEMSNTAPILALMLGLAVGIDYALFIVSRHRSQVKAGMPIDESIARATGTAGTAVVFAGLTVLIALAGLSVVGIPFLTVMGLAAAGTVGISVLIAITLLPALLGFAGEKVLRKKDRAEAAAQRAESTGPHGVIDHAHSPNRWIRMITRRPALVLIVGVLGLGIIAIPTLSLYLGLPDDGTAAPDTTKREAYDLISQSFGPGINGPLLITVAVDDPATMATALPATAQAIQASSDDVADRDPRSGQRRRHLRHRHRGAEVRAVGPGHPATRAQPAGLRVPALGANGRRDHRGHRADRGRHRRLRQARRTRCRST